MLEEEKEKEVVVVEEDEDDKAFIESLLNPKDEVQQNLGEEMTDEQKAEAELKKKNSEEAQKRRDREAKAKEEAEAKAKAEQETKAKEEAEAKAKAEQEAKEKLESEARAKSESDKKQEGAVMALSKQIADFKISHPDIDIVKLQKDANFSEYIRGKLLGNKTFTELFESYVEFVKRIGGKEPDGFKRNAEKPSSGSANKGTTTPTDVYSEDELNKINQRLPFMSRQEAEKISDKLGRSLKYYQTKK